MRSSSKRLGLFGALLAVVAAAATACGGGGGPPAADVAILLTRDSGTRTEIEQADFVSENIEDYLAELGCSSLRVADPYALRVMASEGVDQDSERFPLATLEKAKRLMEKDTLKVVVLLEDVDVHAFGAMMEIRNAKDTAVSGPEYTTNPGGVVVPGQSTTESSGSTFSATFALSTPARARLWARKLVVSPEFPDSTKSSGTVVFGSTDVIGALRNAGLTAALRKARVCQGRGSKSH